MQIASFRFTKRLEQQYYECTLNSNYTCFLYSADQFQPLWPPQLLTPHISIYTALTIYLFIIIRLILLTVSMFMY